MRALHRWALAAALLGAVAAGCGEDAGESAGNRPDSTTTAPTAAGAPAPPAPPAAPQRSQPGHQPPDRNLAPAGDAAEIERLAGDALGGASLRFGKIVYLEGERRATVDVFPSSGPYAGQTVTFTLLRDGGGWRIAAVESDTPVGP